MRRIPFVLLFAVGALLGAAAVVAEEDASWETLFDGQSLAGWEAELHPESFAVVDGAIRAHCTSSAERSHLFFVGPDPQAPRKFANFELVAEARGEPNANAGIFFHTDAAVRDARKHLAKGYEVQLNSSPKEARKTGSLYGIVDLDESPVDETKWFPVRIRVQGKRIQVWIADQLSVDYVEPEHPERAESRKGRLLRTDGGLIALQAHDPGSVFYYRDIRIRELPAGP